ncbi:rfaE bifunctional protein kinase chain/domain/rfaE bifunctional protein nucleotidyltransferase chain/domain [Georgenia soli]|uniref:RfaE bifunctional protein kinase chain/domain/rfaE bifunctional protein nucleotidyltransferase chain/domain n=1 Tax=Georgenia soli TaxID=638953 RepID=A0A2A9ENV8_9MICO|nr:PfkB family carbohydrate kinase [Georgenia soli]PFG39942.1 rfaE bifunctional protein kinase chain/domain/rfaE bifunctional protein nucleotidyltransferase chain/domain [Georgenia soli]
MTRRAPHVVVVGDVVLDRDVDGRVERLSPDAPVPVVDVSGVRESPGGAGLAALLCAAGGARVTLVAPVADDAPGERLAAHLRRAVTLVPLPHEGGTRTKTRVRSGGQSLVRVDDGGPGTPGEPSSAVGEVLADADVVLVSDYGAGVTRDPALREVLSAAARSRRLVWDPHPRGGPSVPGAALVTPNLAEARSAASGDGRTSSASAGEPVSPDAPADVVAAHLADRWSASAVCVTAGAAGAYLARAGTEAVFFPATAVEGDPCGAGDQFAASCAVALARGALVPEAVEGAVADASAWVAAGGAEGFRARESAPSGEGRAAGAATRTGRPDVGEYRPWSEDPASLDRLAARLRADGTVVATGGCFDIVHAGHVATLQAARRLGDRLVVVMNSDASVTRLKGPGRPVVPAPDRARVLAALDCVDAVVVFDEDDPRAVLGRLRPDVWAKGGDYGGTPLPEAEVVRRHGGRVVLLPYLGGRSTTSIIQRSGLARASSTRSSA